jgi:hypothetical protein
MDENMFLIGDMRKDAMKYAANFKELSEEERNYAYNWLVSIVKMCIRARDEGMLALVSGEEERPLDFIAECILDDLSREVITEITANQYEMRTNRGGLDAFTWYVSLRSMLLWRIESYLYHQSNNSTKSSALQHNAFESFITVSK